MSNRAHWRDWLDVFATVAMIAASALIVWSFYSRGPSVPLAPTRPVPSEAIEVNDATSRGSLDAPLTVVMFSDFQCPYCGTFARETVPTIERTFVGSGQVRLVFHHLPLERLHPFSARVASAADCAGDQGKFWEMHDALFDGRRFESDASLVSAAVEIGIQSSGFSDCMDRKSLRIREQVAIAKGLGISGTPTVLLGEKLDDGRIKPIRRFDGHTEAEVLAQAIEDLLR